MAFDRDKILRLLISLYGEQSAGEALGDLQTLLERFCEQHPELRRQPPQPLTQRDIILIVYPDQVQQPDVPPLETLAQFCRRTLGGLISGVHILPFYPSSSDDGFAVMDYRQVDPAFGGWDSIASLRQDFQLMFDAVINHVSSRSEWFQRFLRGDPLYRQYFIVVEGDPDLSQVTRPRALPLLTAFQTAEGERRLWTTFSADQIDLNYRNPRVLLEVVDLLLFYAAQGADFIRLDAIAYLLKEIGTACIHLPQTHAIIRLFRAALQAAAPNLRLITETNVPHAENISYFGDGSDEAHLVYNFALPPLVLFSLLRGEAEKLSAWAAEIKAPSSETAFFNFLASHDGVGLNPVRGILDEAEIGFLVETVEAGGGLTSYKSNPNGSTSPYELNVNYFDALALPGEPPLGAPLERFMLAQAIMLCLAGVPGIYFHSLFGSRGWREGVVLRRSNRAINRQKLRLADLEAELADQTSLRLHVFQRYRALLRARASQAAFHPAADQQVLPLHPAVFAVLRSPRSLGDPPEMGRPVLCLHNLSAVSVEVSLPRRLYLPLHPLHDLISGKEIPLRSGGKLTLSPYQTLWLS